MKEEKGVGFKPHHGRSCANSNDIMLTCTATQLASGIGRMGFRAYQVIEPDD